MSSVLKKADKLNLSLSLSVMSGSRYNAHTGPLFKKLCLVKLSDLLTWNVFKINYKFICLSRSQLMWQICLKTSHAIMYMKPIKS